MDNQTISNLGKKHIKLLLSKIEAIGVLTKPLRKLVLDQFNDLIRELQEQFGE
jgi:hypothetical protein